MLDATLERRRNEDMGQFSLFAESEQAEGTGTVDIPDTEWPPEGQARCSFEKEMLGLYISDLPGSAPVFLHMTADEGHKVVKLSDEHRVEPRSALYAELRELFGQQAVL
jgi:DNA polymerase III alpha subunit